MKRKLISLGIIGLITAVLVFVGVAIGEVSYRAQKDNIDFSGNVLLSGTSVEFTGTTVAINSSILSITSGQTLLETANLTFTGSDTVFSSTTSTFSGTSTVLGGTTTAVTSTWLRVTGIETHTGIESHTGVETHTGAESHSGVLTVTGAVTESGGVTNTNGFIISGGVTNTSTYSVFSGTTTDFSGTTVVLEPTWTRIIGTNLVVSSAETHTGTESHSGVITNTSAGTYSGENTFSGGVTNTGTSKFNGRVQKSWYTPNFKPGTGFSISGTTMAHSYFAVDTSIAVGKGSIDAPGYPLSPSGATVVLPTITADMDGTEFTFVMISGTTTMWFKPTTGTIQTTSGTTGLNISSQPNLTGDSVTWIAAYLSGVSWYAKSTFIQ